MPVVKSIFVSQDGLVHEIIGGVVKKVTKSPFTHVAIGIDLGDGEVIVEAIAPKVCISPIDKYIGEPVYEVLETPVTNMEYSRAVIATRALLGKLYGLDDCIIGGVTDAFGQDIGEIAADVLDWSGSHDCSAVHTLILRAMFSDYLEGRNESTITPNVSYHAILDLNHKLSGNEA